MEDDHRGLPVFTTVGPQTVNELDERLGKINDFLKYSIK